MKIRDVADVRMQSQLNDEDRSAIRRAKSMALLGVAAVIVAALVSPTDEFAPRMSERISSTAAPSSTASTQPTATVGPSAPLFTAPSAASATPVVENIKKTSLH